MTNASNAKQQLREIADQLVAHCKANTEAEALTTLYAPDAVSVEATDMSGAGAESAGVEAIRAKHEWWSGAMEVHDATVEGPFHHGDDRFGVIFSVDATTRESGKRSQMRELGIYTVSNGKITREEFFYDC
ncbi:MAG: nuclear transport factor 2 family protein [Rhodobacteraceae bacterium]|nr:nuclear transport factor 2 family protein [Paracoccaceae bacterium]